MLVADFLGWLSNLLVLGNGGGPIKVSDDSSSRGDSKSSGQLRGDEIVESSSSQSGDDAKCSTLFPRSSSAAVLPFIASSTVVLPVSSPLPLRFFKPKRDDSFIERRDRVRCLVADLPPSVADESPPYGIEVSVSFSYVPLRINLPSATAEFFSFASCCCFPVC